ncbi:MAG: DUF1893 domain-containing protein [Bacteroidales bacterium]|nr:DUF1893 domain-containing protein [Bacteroidales bacterium]
MTIESLKEILLKDFNTIAIYKSDGSLVVSHDRGVAPLMNLLKNDKSQLKDSIVADKVIGKAAALLMAYAHVKEVYTPIVSSPALKVFKEHNICIHYDMEVERIINRKGDGLCPMETLCLDVDNPEDAYIRIKCELEKNLSLH